MPKPCVPVLNIPLGLWPLHHLLSAGVTDLVVNTHHLPDQVEDLFRSQSSRLNSLNFSSEKKTILGSGGGIAKAKPFLIGPDSFWVANGDEVFLPTQEDIFLEAWKQHQKTRAFATLLVMKHAEVGKKFGGVWVDKSGHVKGFGKQSPSAELVGYHYTGFQIISPEVFKYFSSAEVESNIFYDIYVKAIAAGEKVQIVSAWGDWFETGNQSDLLAATKELLQLSGSNTALQSFLAQNGAGDLKKGSLIHPTASIDPSSTLLGYVVAGKNSKIGPAVRVQNSVILPNSIVSENLEEKIL
jgi:mannose-1-phosphate guanylyltransferase